MQRLLVENRHHWPALAIAVVVFVAHTIYSIVLSVPGTDDGLVYFHVAQRIVMGDGITLPYVWNFLSNPESVNPPAFGYWMPLASFITVPGLFLFGTDSIVGAMLAQSLLLVVLVLITYGVGSLLTKSRLLASAAAFVVVLNPWTVERMGASESAFPAAVTGAVAYLAIAYAMSDGISPKRSRWFAILSGVSAGLANLSRGDGVLVMIIIILTVLAFALIPVLKKSAHGLNTRQGMLLAGFILVGFLLVMAPWYVRNNGVFDSPFPPGSSAVWATDYEDIYSTGERLTISEYFGQSLRELVRKRVLATGVGLVQIISSFALIIPLIVIFIANRWLRWPLVLVLGAVHLVLGQAVYVLFLTELCCTPSRSVLVAVPFLGFAFALGLVELRQTVRIAVVAAVVGVLFISAANSVYDRLKLVDEMERNYEWLGTVVREDARINGEEDPVVMSRKPWRVHEIADLTSVQIPNEDMNRIIEVAAMFDVSYIHIKSASTRLSLSDLYDEVSHDGNIVLVSELGNHKVFRLHY